MENLTVHYITELFYFLFKVFFCVSVQLIHRLFACAEQTIAECWSVKMLQQEKPCNTIYRAGLSRMSKSFFLLVLRPLYSQDKLSLILL